MPALVKRAQNLAEQMSYGGSCSPEAGRLLQILTSQFHSGVIGEICTGCGMGAAWIVNALSPSTSFFTVEADPARAAAVRTLFDPLLNVRVIQGDWREFVQNWQFGMLFASAKSSRAEHPEALIRSLRDGSLIVLDGLPPQGKVSLKMGQDATMVRDFWLNDPRVLATELMVSSTEAVIIATRMG
jgi:predicted O-methyltransferase YrrM